MNDTQPAELQRITDDMRVSVDVRDDLRNGREPFSTIMAALRSVPAGGALGVRAIFEPVPLYRALERQGLAHWTEELAADDWLVWFYPEPAAGSDDVASGDDVVLLDVRHLEPPEPMVRTLAALEALRPGATLVQLNTRVPQFLLPVLQERGYGCEVSEHDDGVVRVFIRRVNGD